MSTLATNRFTTYTHSEREYAESKTFNDLQVEGIMNLRASVADQLLSLIYDPLNPHDFGLQQASLSGQLAAYDYLLEAHKEAIDALLEIARREAAEQQSR